MPTVRVLRPFANGHHDRIVHPGDMIAVDEDRARALSENGLVEPAVSVEAMIKVQALKEFAISEPFLIKQGHAGPPFRKVVPGDLLNVRESVVNELCGQGSVELFPGEKAAPVPVNKMAPAPVTKAPAAPARRGRPPKVR